jgi:hypothetical protein
MKKTPTTLFGAFQHLLFGTMLLLTSLFCHSNCRAEVLYANHFDDKPNWTSPSTGGGHSAHADAVSIGFTSYSIGGHSPTTPVFQIDSNGRRGTTGKGLTVNCYGTIGAYWYGGRLEVHFADTDTFPEEVDDDGYAELFIRYYQRWEKGFTGFQGNPDYGLIKNFRAYSKVDYQYHITNGINLSDADNNAHGAPCKTGYIITDWGKNFIIAYRETPSCSTQSDQDYGCPWTSAFADEGWHCVEYRIKMNDVGKSNALCDLYIDGVKVAGLSVPVALRQASDRKFNMIALFDNHFIKYAGVQRYYIDDIVISTSYIGTSTALLAPANLTIAVSN